MDGYVQTNVRIPKGIKEWLRQEAKKNRRSLSAEITYRLEQSRATQKRREKRSRRSE